MSSSRPLSAPPTAGAGPDCLRRAGVNAVVMIPTFNERESLPGLLLRLELLRDRVDVLVVDDASPDGTAGWTADRRAAHPGLHVWAQDCRRGFGPSCRLGLAWAGRQGYEYVVQMDADLSHDPDVIPALLACAQTADLVIGSRYIGGGSGTRNWSRFRRWLSRSAGLYVRACTGLPLQDPTAGFRCYRTAALADGPLDGRADGYAFQVEMAHRLWRRGARLVEHPIVFHERRHGHSKMSWRIIREAIVLVPRLRRQP